MKLFASDFDGTLYFGRDNYELFKKNADSIKRYQQTGCFAVITGRDRDSVEKQLAKVALKPDYMAAYSGAYITDKSGRVIYDKKLKIDIVKLEKMCEKYTIRQYIVMGNHQFCCRPFKLYLKQILKRLVHGRNNIKLIYQLEKINADDVYACSIGFLNEKEALKAAEELRSCFNCRFLVNRQYIDVVANDAGKANAVDMIGRQQSFDKVYVIGDSYNDLDMIKQYHGFTVKSGSDSVKQAASRIVGSVSEAIEMISNYE